jgi:hypothetical protein
MDPDTARGEVFATMCRWQDSLLGQPDGDADVGAVRSDHLDAVSEVDDFSWLQFGVVRTGRGLGMHALIWVEAGLLGRGSGPGRAAVFAADDDSVVTVGKHLPPPKLRTAAAAGVGHREAAEPMTLTTRYVRSLALMTAGCRSA